MLLRPVSQYSQYRGRGGTGWSRGPRRRSGARACRRPGWPRAEWRVGRMAGQARKAPPCVRGPRCIKLRHFDAKWAPAPYGKHEDDDMHSPGSRSWMQPALGAVLFLLAAAPRADAQTTADRDAVLATVQTLFDTMAARDVEGARRVMVPDGRFYAMEMRGPTTALQSFTNE